MNTKVFAQLLKTWLFTIMLAIISNVFTACDKDGNSLESTPQSMDVNEAIPASLNISARNASIYDESVFVDLSNYQHLIEERGDFGMCGAMTYVVGKHLRNSNYEASKNNAQDIISKRGSKPSVYDLFLYSKQPYSTLLRENAGNRLFGAKRDKLKKFIYENLVAGNPVLLSTIYNMSTDPRSKNANHFYLIVGLDRYHVKGDSSYDYGGTGSIVYVKDVWRGNRSDSEVSETLAFSYSDLLSSVWYSTQRKYENGVMTNPVGRKGSETYCALALVP